MMAYSYQCIAVFVLNILQTIVVELHAHPFPVQRTAGNSLDNVTVAFYRTPFPKLEPRTEPGDVVIEASRDEIKSENPSITEVEKVNQQPALSSITSTSTSLTTEKPKITTEMSMTTDIGKLFNLNETMVYPDVEYVGDTFTETKPSNGEVSTISEAAITEAVTSIDNNETLEITSVTDGQERNSGDSAILSFVTFSTTTYVTNPNCTGYVVYLPQNRTYCVNAWGREYKSMVWPSTTPSGLIETDSDVWVDGEDLSFSENGITIDLDDPEFALQMFCPESLYCPLVQKYSETPSSSCCLQCDCSDACAVLGTCCLYKNVTEQAHQQVRSKATETCVKTYIGDDMYQKLGLHSTLTFMLIQSCPEVNTDVNDNGIEEKCIRPDEKSLDGIVPFYSRKSSRNYRNFYCALCNNDSEDGEYWGTFSSCPSVDCFNSLFKTTIEPPGNWLLSHIQQITEGLLYWKPASDQVKSCLYQDSIISTCNINNKFSGIIDDLCSKYYAPVRGRYGVYKNWFCLVCNDDDTNQVWDCPTEESGILTAQISLDGYLKITSPDREEKKEVDSGCENGLHFDSRLNECVRKSCAIDQVMVDGACFPFITHLSESSLDYRLNVVYPLNKVPSVDSILESIRSLSLLPDDNGNCEERILGIDTRGEQTVVSVQLVKSLKEFRNIRAEYQTFLERVIQFNVNLLGNQSPYEVEIAIAPLVPVVEGYVSFSVFSDVTSSSDCGSPIAMSEMQFCDTVLLYDFTLNFNGIVYAENAVFIPGEYVAKVGNTTSGMDDIKSVSICYDLYISRIMESKEYITTTDLDLIRNGAPSCLLSEKWLLVIQLIILIGNITFRGSLGLEVQFLNF